MSTKDNAGSLVAGIMWHAEQQRVNNERIKQQQDKTNEEIKRNAELSEIIKREQKKSNDTVLDLEEDVGELQKALLDTVKIAANLKKENEYYKSLLAKPMQVIAEQNGDFKKTYEEQQALLADWMVSQKAFKELAINYGKRLGLSSVEVRREGKNKEIGVINCEFDPKHQTTAGDFIAYYRDRLLNQHTQPSKFRAELDELLSSGELYPVGDENASQWYEAFDAWHKLALSDNAKAQFNLGRCFHFGSGVTVSEEQAIHWYKQALSNGEPQSAFNLYLIHKPKEPEDKPTPIQQEYLRIACDLGDARALKEMAKLDEIQSNIELENKRLAEEERRKIHEKTRVENQYSALRLLEEMSLIKQGVEYPEQKIRTITELDSEIGDFASLCHRLKVDIDYGETRNIGSFFKPCKVRDVKVRLSHELADKTFIIYTACFDDEHNRDKFDLKGIALSDKRVSIIERNDYPFEKKVEKILVWPKFKVGKPVVIQLL